MTQINLVYMTAASKAEAERIGRELVTSKLAACVNIFEGMSSIYIWQDALQSDSEAVMIAKTTEAKVEQLIERVKALHSYDCPCIIRLAVSGGHQPFLDWIAGQVA